MKWNTSPLGDQLSAYIGKGSFQWVYETEARLRQKKRPAALSAVGATHVFTVVTEKNWGTNPTV